MAKKNSNRLDALMAKFDKPDSGIRFGEAVIGGYLDSGNLALNALLCGRPDGGYPLGRTSIISGLQGSGKTYLGSNAAREALNADFDAVILIDTEKAADIDALRRIGVDVDHPNFKIIQVTEIEKIQEVTAAILNLYNDSDKVLIIVDSLSNSVLSNALAKNDKGEVAYGQGQKEKVYKQYVQYLNGRMGHMWHCMFIAHEYVAKTDMHGNPVTVPSVGKGTLYIPSIGVSLKQYDLKEGKEQIGISVDATVFKSRFVKKGTNLKFALPWDRGMDRYDGFADALVAKNVIEKNGGWFSYTFEGTEYKFQGKGISDHVDRLNALYAECVGEIEELDIEDADKQVSELIADTESTKKFEKKTLSSVKK